MRWSVPYLVVVLALTALGAAAWLTRYPDSQVVRGAESWPWIGAWATKFRQAYEPPPEYAPGQGSVEWVVQPPSTPASPPWTGVPEYLWVLEGTKIFPEPRLGSGPARKLTAITNLARLERRGDWFRVWFRGQEGWVHWPGYQEDVPPLGSQPDPVLPLPPREPGVQRLARARSLLGDGAYEVDLSGYQLYTDSWDTDLIGWMGRVLGQIETVYEQRYGVELLGQPMGAIVLYRQQTSLEELQRLEGLEGLPANGHAARGVAALAVGRRPRHEVLATLVHEVAHLMHRRAVGPALPPWLEEGLCDDLANLPVGADGALLWVGWNGRRLVGDGRVTYEGAMASLRVTLRQVRAGYAPGFEELLGYDWQEFVVSKRSRLHYDLSAFFIRHLLDDPEHGPAFRGFLRATAAGEPISPEALRRHLDRPWSQLEADFLAWLEQQVTVRSALMRPAAPGAVASEPAGARAAAAG